MFKSLGRSPAPTDLLESSLYDEATFYDKFLGDLKNCQQELIIESPFATTKRLLVLMPTFEKLKSRKVRIVINMRDPDEHEDEYMRHEARRTVSKLQHIGIQVIYTRGHHRKLAILDRKVLYEGSLNILSQNSSCEIMRRIESVQLAWQMARFVQIDQYIG